MKLSETRMSAWLKGRGACGDGAAWAGDKTLREAWETCHRPGWLLWALDQAGLRDAAKDQWAACWSDRMTRASIPHAASEEEAWAAIQAAGDLLFAAHAAALRTIYGDPFATQQPN